MSLFQDHAEFYNQPIHLTPQQKNAPLEVLVNFSEDHKLSELRDYLYEISETCLTTDEWPFNEAKKRVELLFYHQKIEILLEAAWLISKSHKGKGGGSLIVY